MRRSQTLIRYTALALTAFAIIVGCTDFQEEDTPVGLSVSAQELSFSQNAETRSLTLSSGTKWDVASIPGWVSLGKISRSGMSPYEWAVDFSASANDEYNRDGMIVFRTQSETKEISVTQEGKRGRYIAVESVSVSPTELSLTVGENTSLTHVITPSNASIKDVTWKSSNPSVATVSQSGLVEALAVGKTVITVTTEDGGKTASCSVTVNPVPVRSVSLDKESIALKIGETSSLTATVLPENAANKNVVWSSSNPSVATVDSNGKVTGISVGSANITVTTEDGGKTATCAVTVQSQGAPPEAVDLGLPSGLKWASHNMGASAPEEYGDYYAWGEFETKNSYSWFNYKWCNGSYITLTKYNYISDYGTVDKKLVLDAADDVACVILGGKWRIPTDAEWTELRNNCTWVWTSLNGKNGYRVTGKNGNSIFFPAAGYRANTDLHDVGSYCYYWSSSLSKENPSRAWHMFMYFSYYNRFSMYRYNGTSVRPVSGDWVFPESVTLNYSSLSLTVRTSERLYETVFPLNATDKSVTWSTSDPSVVTVSSEGSVTAIATGDATITVTTSDGGKTATCSVTVSEATPEAIDLGLPSGVKWASFNIGASAPEEYGYYYAWGETEPYYSSLDPLTWRPNKSAGYYWDSYKWYNALSNTLTKYNTKSNYGIVDDKNALDAADDVAHVILGSKWRIPTDAEWTELRAECTWAWTTRNNVKGCLVTGKNGNSIFLPGAGFWSNTTLFNVDQGYYWTSSLGIDSPLCAWYVFFRSKDVYRNENDRSKGQPVRPVTK